MAIPISTQSYFESNDRTLSGVFLQNRLQFFIPFNQRPWAWSIKRVNELWKDILSTMSNFHESAISNPPFKPRAQATNDPHFLGAFLFEHVNNEKYEVVDGQQRLTALIMIMAVLRELASILSASASLSAQQRNIIVDQMVNNLTRWIEADPIGMEDRPRLVVDEGYLPLFLALVRNRDATIRAKEVENLGIDFANSRNHKHLFETFNRVHDAISDTVNKYSHEEQFYFLDAVIHTIQSYFLCIATVVKKPSFSFSVFKSLNAKMTPLTEVDKIKNELFLLAPHSSHPNVKGTWDQIYECVPGGDIATFLRNRHQAVIGECPKSKLYEYVLENELSKSKTIDAVLDKWRQDAQRIRRVTLKEPYFSGPKTIDALGHLISPLRISLSQILLLAAARTYSGKNNSDFEKAAILTRNVCFRAITVMGEDTSVLESALGHASRMLTKDGKSLQAVAEYLKGRFPDSDFKERFEVLREMRPRIQFYILEEFEKYLGSAAGVIPHPHSFSQHIEHIMPKKFAKAKKRTSEWMWAKGDREKHSLYLNSIGNLLILERDINRDVSNFEFAAKQTAVYPTGSKSPRRGYKDSALRMPKELSDTAKFPNWSFAAIKGRQSCMADQAVKIWSLNV